MKKQYLVVSLAVAFGASIITAQAGTTHSLGGHSMVNARNYSASHNFGGHNFGGHRGGGMSKYYQGKIAEYIRAHGGTVTVNRDTSTGTATVNATTGKGGTFSGSASRLQGNTLHESAYAYSANMSGVKGNSYSGTGQAKITKESVGLKTGLKSLLKGSSDGIISVKGEASHSGTINGNKVLNVSATSAINLMKNSQSLVHTNYTADTSWKNYHSSSTTMLRDENGKMINHSESENITGSRGNNLKTYTETTINKNIFSGVEVTHPNADSQYVLVNNHPINPKVSPKARA